MYYNITRKKDIMSNKTAKGLIFGSAILLIVVGIGLYKLFDYQGYGDKNTSNYVNYNVNNYIEITPVIFNNYDDVYSNINVSKIDIKNVDSEVTKDFLKSENEIINYISGYYNEIKSDKEYIPVNTATSDIKTQINGAILSIYYEMNIKLDENLFNDNIRHYIVTTNIDLGTGRILSIDDLLNKYSYTREYIAEKIFDEDVLINSNEVVIDKNTNISLTKSDIVRKKSEYVDRIVDSFDNIIKVYIENGYLTIVYDKKELKGMFFDNAFDTEIKTRYLR